MITNTVRPGSTDMLHGWEKANANELLPRDFDPISGFPPFKEGLCQVSKVSGRAASQVAPQYEASKAPGRAAS
jgi:hypothetical protein